MAGADRRRAGAVSRRLRPVPAQPGAARRGHCALRPTEQPAGSKAPAPGGAPAPQKARPGSNPQPDRSSQPGPAGLQNPYGRYFSAPRSFEQLVRARRGKGGQPR